MQALGTLCVGIAVAAQSRSYLVLHFVTNHEHNLVVVVVRLLAFA